MLYALEGSIFCSYLIEKIKWLTIMNFHINEVVEHLVLKCYFLIILLLIGEVMKSGNILIVDDEEQIRDVYKSVLDPITSQIFEAEDVEEALEVVQRAPIHLILLDLKLIGASGIELLKTMNSFKIRIPVVVISAFKTEGMTTKAIELGAIDFISKPVDPEQLLSMAKEAVNVGIEIQNLTDEYTQKLEKKIYFLRLKYNNKRLKSS